MGVALCLRADEIAMVCEIMPLLTVGCLTKVEGHIPIEIHGHTTQCVRILNQEPITQNCGDVVLPGGTCRTCPAVHSANGVLSNDLAMDVLDHTWKIGHVDVLHGVWSLAIELLSAVHEQLDNGIVGCISVSC